MKKTERIYKTTRAYTLKMYPSKEQKKSLRRVADLHCNLYNAALQERIDAYKKQKISMDILIHFIKLQNAILVKAKDIHRKPVFLKNNGMDICHLNPKIGEVCHFLPMIQMFVNLQRTWG